MTVKDAQEHLYMAVDKAEKKNRLIGVLHHSLAGDRALFKVYKSCPFLTVQIVFCSQAQKIDYSC